jgi:hypothetical protein
MFRRQKDVPWGLPDPAQAPDPPMIFNDYVQTDPWPEERPSYTVWRPGMEIQTPEAPAPKRGLKRLIAKMHGR